VIRERLSIRTPAPTPLGERKPNIKSLVRREDIDGLLEAATYRELASGPDGAMRDLGIPVRAEAILALGTLAPEEGEQAITAALRDPADRVRCEAVRVLHALREIAAVAEAVQWLPQQGHSRKLAIQALLDLRESVPASTLTEALVRRSDDELLGDQDAQLVLELIEGEPRDATDEVLEVLLTALGDERGIVVDRAAELLTRLAPGSTDALVDELRAGPNPAEAAYILGRIGDPRTFDQLVKALWHTDAKVRAESAAALAELRDPAAVKPLLAATRDPEHNVRTQAGAALDRMDTTAVIFGVAALLQTTIEGAARSALPQPEVEPNGRHQAPDPKARKQSRSHRSNGGPPEAADPRSPGQERTP
jgi:HEAT repeat protein